MLLSSGPLQGCTTADVVVVGAGFASLWFAYLASQRGFRVMVLDGEAPGYGASGRNGGLMTGGLALSPRDAVQQWGEGLSVNLYRRVIRAHEAIRQAAAGGHGGERLEVGRMFGAAGGSYGVGDAEGECCLSRGSWISEPSVSGADLPGILKHSWPGGLVYPSDGSWQPMKLVRWLVGAVESRGGTVFGRSLVRDIREESGSVAVRTDRGQAEADYAVLAVNASLGRLIPPLAAAVVPTRGQMLVSEPVDPLPYAWAVSADWGYLYWHQRVDGRIALGGFRNLDVDRESSNELALNPRIQEVRDQWLSDRIVGRPVAWTTDGQGIYA